MKKINIYYWITTILIAGYMIFTAVPNIISNQQSIDFIHGYLGYPIYFISFIGIAKIIGSITLLVPGLKSIKEWAYAGLLFDLVAATYSIISVAKKADGQTLLFMGLPIVVLFVSYFLWRKKMGMQ